ncbi:MAG: hypothetical protein AAFQ98_20930, partial [Bacteroidota bacterium]
MRRVVYGVFLLLLTGSCATSQTKVAHWGQDEILAFGDAFELPSDLGIIKFSKLIKDHRCPIDAQCITQGTVVVELTYSSQGSASTIIQLSLGDDPNLVYSFSRFSVELKEVA